MLKGFVSGEEKDIVRIPMKGKNLFDKTTATIGKRVVVNGINTDATKAHSDYIDLSGINAISVSSGIGDATNIYFYSSKTNTADSYVRARTASVPQGAKYCRVNMLVDDVDTFMLNAGDTPLPYEPYGYQEGWEVRDNQDRLIWGREDELQTATGTLPFKGYSLPLKVKSLLGNAVQNGTPSPGPVNPNLADPSKTVPGYQESNGSIHTPSAAEEITTDFIPFTNTLYILISGSANGDMNYAAYNANKQIIGIYNTGFTPNTVITANPQTYTGAAYLRVSWTHGVDQPICITTKQTATFIPFDPNPPGPVIPEMCGVRTGNLAPPLTEWADGYINSGTGTIHEPSAAQEKTSPFINVQDIPRSNFLYMQYEGGEFPNGGSGSAWTCIGYYNGNRELISRPTSTGEGAVKQYTISENAVYCRLSFRTYGETGSISLSAGKQPPAYEPYGWKVPFENRGENLIPAIRSANGWVIGYRNSSNGSYTSNNWNGEWLSPKIPLTAGETITISAPQTPSASMTIYFWNGSTYITHDSDTDYNGSKFTAPAGTTQIDFAIRAGVDNKTEANVIANGFWAMLSLGSEAKPYSPYLNETVPVYLGEVPTVRRVKKLVLDGTEEWSYDAQYTRFITEKSDFVTLGLRITPFMSNSFTSVDDGRPISSVPDNSVYSGAGDYPHTIYIKCSEFASVEAWKSWLAEKYANGTPVIIWYILRNEQTTISNEPLCKISTYADELTTIQVHGLSAPLYGIGDHKDTLNLSTGVVTRKVKKLVLTGGEAWNQDSVDDNRTVCNLSLTGVAGNYGYCSHIEWKSPYQTTEYDRVVWNNAGGGRLYISLSNGYLSSQTVNAFKAFLAAQYAAGTPVTIWYVLSTPTTETVTVPTGMTGEIEGYLTQVSTPTPTNRSVPKWNGVEETGGTYAVTVYTPPEIPTTTGQNTLTVETEKIHGLANPLCGIGDYKDVLNLSTGVITRKIKKLVLTGQEDLTTNYVNVNRAEIVIELGLSGKTIPLMSTHYGYDYGFRDNMAYVGDSHPDTLYINDNTHATSAADFKAFLAAQYAAGTPVTVWYVLDTPETETITVPYGLECSVEGYLTQSTTPTPSSPIAPDSNGILESGGTYAVEVSLVPSNLTVKGHIKELT